MCSGCSGNYAGEFGDDPGEASANAEEANSPAWNRGGPDKQRSQAEETGGSEANLPVGGDDQPATASGSKDENAAEVWEILVSETRIIEIRTIAARDCELKEWAGAGAEKTSAASQHSIAPSAKHYPTRSAREKKRRSRGNAGFSRDWLSAGRQFSRWMQWSRKRLAISRVKNSL